MPLLIDIWCHYHLINFFVYCSMCSFRDCFADQRARTKIEWRKKNSFSNFAFKANKIITGVGFLYFFLIIERKISDWKRNTKKKKLSPIIHRHFVSIERIFDTFSRKMFEENENGMAGVGFSPTVQSSNRNSDYFCQSPLQSCQLLRPRPTSITLQ